jgi:hypothetical protein
MNEPESEPDPNSPAEIAANYSKCGLSLKQKQAGEIELLKSLKDMLANLESLLTADSDEWHYEDPVYRFYHASFKVFYLQETTATIVQTLQSLVPRLPLNVRFLQIVAEGTGKSFTPADNNRWTQATRPILEAFFHARYFLEMACKYGKQLDVPPQPMPSGWAALLYLYNLR